MAIFKTSRKSISHAFLLTFVITIVLRTCFATTAYGCTSPYTYITASNAPSLQTKICAAATDSTEYRIGGGASVICKSGVLSVTQSQVNVLSNAICGTPHVVKVSPSTSCSSGSTSCSSCTNRVSRTDALAYTSFYCSLLSVGETVRLQTLGNSMSKNSGGTCQVNSGDYSSMDGALCYSTTVSVYDIQIVSSQESVCPSCETLYTANEITSSICTSKLTSGQTKRLAGGASVTRSGPSCTVDSDDNSASVSLVLCGALTSRCPDGYYENSCVCTGKKISLYF